MKRRCKANRAAVVKESAPLMFRVEMAPLAPQNHMMLAKSTSPSSTCSIEDLTVALVLALIFLHSVWRRFTVADPSDPKRAALKQDGVLNPHPDDVIDPLFVEREFFDARDLVQVKYEMLRRVEQDGDSVTAASKAFGFSRPTFYEARRAFDHGGLLGLLPAKRGPRGPRKLTHEVMAFVENLLDEQRALGTPAIARAVEERFGLSVHPRSIERALARRKRGLP